MFKGRKAVIPESNLQKTSSLGESNSKIVGVVCATFGDVSTKYVLDFSSVKQRNIDFFSQFPCYYQVLEFYEAFQALSKEKEEGNSNFQESYVGLIRDFGEQLASGAKKYDVIFLWDILNYLDESQVEMLFVVLKKYCHMKTHIYCMVSINITIPKSPMNCYVIDHNTVGYEQCAEDAEMIPNPNYSKQSIPGMGTAYTLQQSFLLKNGIKEMLFSLNRVNT